SLRVKAWRRLRVLGAVALKKSVYLLPFSADNQEQFQWLTQEVQNDGGDATLLKVDQIETMAPAEIVRLFQEARNEEYRALSARYEAIARGLDRRARGLGGARRAGGVGPPAQEGGGGPAILVLLAARHVACVRRAGATPALGLAQASPAGRAPAASVDRERLRGRQWATRPRPHVDRLGSAWLIRRFIDPEAAILFAPPEAFPPEAIPFDVLGAEFG